MFVKVSICVALVDPTVVFGNVSEPGETVAVVVGATPIPVRFTVCGLLASLSVMLITALLDPATDGLNVTLIAQLAPAANDVPHELVWLKSPLSGPPTAIPVIAKAVVPVFVRVVL